MYFHIMSEPKTNEDSKEVQTEKLSLKAVPLANGMVKAKTGNTTDATTYADWYKAVYVPAAERLDVYLSILYLNGGVLYGNN